MLRAHEICGRNETKWLAIEGLWLIWLLRTQRLQWYHRLLPHFTHRHSPLSILRTAIVGYFTSSHAQGVPGGIRSDCDLIMAVCIPNTNQSERLYCFSGMRWSLLPCPIGDWCVIAEYGLPDGKYTTIRKSVVCKSPRYPQSLSGKQWTQQTPLQGIAA